MPRFSVIIPAFNGSSTLGRAIDSVLGQTTSAHEILVVDDASSDDTPRVAAAYGNRIRYLRRPANAGVSAARNFGIEQATGDWIAFLDADDWYLPDRLAAHADWIREDPTLELLTADYEYRDVQGDVLGTSLQSHPLEQALMDRADQATGRCELRSNEIEAFVTRHFGDMHTLSVRRARSIEVGGFPLGFRVCEDVHFLTRLVASSPRIGVICRPLAVYVIHANSATRSDPLAAQIENVRTLTHLRAMSDKFPPAVRRGVCRRLRAARLNYAYVLLRTGRKRDALRAVLTNLREAPGWRPLRDVASILRG